MSWIALRSTTTRIYRPPGAMKIKRLEIKGFKSFPDKTVLEFKSGTTGVVGPNGCGKSNVLDSIRWVMGEQRARTLRGKKMEDVIFNGSETRKPVGMAEVRLVLSNTDGLGPVSMADYDEIMIVRRLFRDGESQYELNNVSCRMSDVVDFFLDTGVGKNSYAIIEQGRVDMIVASKPEDRRVLIEEAAGINRYKSRKEAALKKLEQTQQNLARIRDVIGEVKRQSAVLKRQASKAERYRKLSEHLRETDLAIHSWRCAELHAEIKKIAEQLEQERLRLAENEAGDSEISALLEANRLEALETESKLKELLESIHRVDVELTAVRGSAEKNRTAISQFSERRKRSAEERVLLEQKLKELMLRRDASEKDRKRLAEETEAASGELKKSLAEMREADQGLNEERKRSERLKDEVFQTLQETAQERNRLAGLIKRRKEIDASLEKLKAEEESTGNSLEKDRIENDELGLRAQEASSQRTSETERMNGLSASREDWRHKIATLRESIASQERNLAAVKARLDSLTEMQHDFRAYDEGVRFLMKNRDSQADSSLLGPLAEMIDVAPEYQRALTAALGDRLGYVVVESTRAGIEAANRLKEARGGRSGFLPLSPRLESEDDCGSSSVEARPLRELVKVRGGCETLARFLLRRCFLVDDVDAAMLLWERGETFGDLVTRSGEMLTRHGEIIGGTEDSRSDEIFERRREVAALKDMAEEAAENIHDLRTSFIVAESQDKTISTDLDLCRRNINELNVKEAGLRKDRERLDAQIAGHQRRLQVLKLEAQNLAKERQAQEDQIGTAEANVSTFEIRRADLELQREQASRKAEDLHASARERSRRTGELRVKLAQLEERKRSLEREFETLEETVQQYTARISGLATDISDAADQEKRLAEELEKSLEREQELLATQAVRAEEIRAVRQKSEELSAFVKKLEEKSALFAKALKELRETVHGLEMESVKFEQTLDGIVEKIIERYRVDPRTVSRPDSLPDDSQLDDVRAKLEAMGEVNPAAINESRQIEERLAFLVEQEQDLKKAVESLYATINAINKTTKERFRAAFDNINRQFQEIFPFLFRGGEARLELTDEDNLLDTGVEILARPPGKRIQNMDLLSGGEKALTAVALIFSIFLTKPSPFCLLDEVDAPLDDSNLARFNEMLRKLSDRTQFLIITHNKKSMEEADTLYGVTMEESGVSRVVSVEFVS